MPSSAGLCPFYGLKYWFFKVHHTKRCGKLKYMRTGVYKHINDIRIWEYICVKGDCVKAGLPPDGYSVRRQPWICYAARVFVCSGFFLLLCLKYRSYALFTELFSLAIRSIILKDKYVENVHTGEAERKNRYAGVHVSVCIFRCVFSQSSILYEPILALIFREYKR